MQSFLSSKAGCAGPDRIEQQQHDMAFRGCFAGSNQTSRDPPSTCSVIPILKPLLIRNTTAVPAPAAAPYVEPSEIVPVLGEFAIDRTSSVQATEMVDALPVDLVNHCSGLPASQLKPIASSAFCDARTLIQHFSSTDAEWLHFAPDGTSASQGRGRSGRNSSNPHIRPDLLNLMIDQEARQPVYERADHVTLLIRRRSTKPGTPDMTEAGRRTASTGLSDPAEQPDQTIPSCWAVITSIFGTSWA